MKKHRSSKVITLAILSSTIVSCTKEAVKQEQVNNGQEVFMRADTTAKFSDVTKNVVSEKHYEKNHDNTVHHYHHSSGMSGTDAMLMYMAFNNSNHGYTSGSLAHESNVGSNSDKRSYAASSRSYRSTNTPSSYVSAKRSGSSFGSSSSKSSSVSRGGFGSSSFHSSAS